MFVLLAMVQRVVLPALIAVNMEPLFIKDHQTPQQQRLCLAHVQQVNTVAKDKSLVLIVVQGKKQALMALGQKHVQNVMLVHTATVQQMRYVKHVMLVHIKMQKANHPVIRVTTDTTKMKKGKQHAKPVMMAIIRQMTENLILHASLVKVIKSATMTIMVVSLVLNPMVKFLITINAGFAQVEQRLIQQETDVKHAQVAHIIKMQKAPAICVALGL